MSENQKLQYKLFVKENLLAVRVQFVFPKTSHNMSLHESILMKKLVRELENM